MNDASKTSELIAESRKFLFIDSRYGYEDTVEGDLIYRLADALKAATRVPVQGEPNDDREGGEKDEIYDLICESASVEEAAEVILARFPEITRTTVPDAATDKPDPCEMTHTPPFDFAQCETHDTTFPLGGKCKWHGRTSIVEVLQEEIDEQRARAVRAEHEHGEADKARHWFEVAHKSHERADKAEAERDAALAAVSDARAVCLHLGCIDGDVSQPAPSYYVSVGRNVVATEVLAALDGAPEPEAVEWEYAVGGMNPGSTEAWAHDEDVISSNFDTARAWTDEAIASGSFSNAIVVKRRVNPWLPVEGEKP